MNKQAKATAKLSDAKGDAFLGMEVSWELGTSRDALAVRIPRDAAALAFDAALPPRRTNPIQPLSPEAALKAATDVGWARRLGLSQRKFSRLRHTAEDRAVTVLGVFFADSDDESTAQWLLGARVRIEGGFAVVRPPDGSTDYPDEGSHRTAVAIADETNLRLSTVGNTELSSALCDLVAMLGGISQRKNSGGVYFLPRGPSDVGPCDSFADVLDALEAVSDGQFNGNCIPQFANPRTLKTWTRRAGEDFDTAIAELTEELERWQTTGRGTETTVLERQAQTFDLLRRADMFSALLGDRLAEVKSRVESIRSDLSALDLRAIRAATGIPWKRGAEVMADVSGEVSAKPARRTRAKKAPAVVARRTRQPVTADDIQAASDAFDFAG